jgi:hypothetical protein
MFEQIIGFLPNILSFALGVGGVMVIIKKYYRPAKEVGELLVTVAGAIEDGKVTKEELDQIVKEAKDIPEAIKAVSKVKGK